MKKLLPSSYSNKTSGFTLIELMVVIAIIAILSVVGITIFSTAQASARDARRKADVQAAANALETHFAAGAYIPLAPDMFAGGATPTGITVTYPTAATFTVCSEKLDKSGGNASSNTGTGLGATSGDYFCIKSAQ